MEKKRRRKRRGGKKRNVRVKGRQESVKWMKGKGNARRKGEVNGGSEWERRYRY